MFSLHQAAREQWSETLWSNLNVQVLQEGIDTFLKNLRKLPREVKNMAVGRCLDEKLKEFRDSLPLFMDLKHEALRDRYAARFLRGGVGERYRCARNGG